MTGHVCDYVSGHVASNVIWGPNFRDPARLGGGAHTCANRYRCCWGVKPCLGQHLLPPPLVSDSF